MEVPELLEMPEVPAARPGRASDRECPGAVPLAPPLGLDSALYEHDERASRADLRRQIAAMESELARLFGSAFPRQGIDFGAPASAPGPRLLSVSELERVRDARLAPARGPRAARRAGSGRAAAAAADRGNGR